VQRQPAHAQVELASAPRQVGRVAAQERDVVQAVGQQPALLQHFRRQVERADVHHVRRQRPPEVGRPRRDVQHHVRGARRQPRHDPVQTGDGEARVRERRSL
jgi:hypothetical protein